MNKARYGARVLLRNVQTLKRCKRDSGTLKPVTALLATGAWACVAIGSPTAVPSIAHAQSPIAPQAMPDLPPADPLVSFDGGRIERADLEAAAKARLPRTRRELAADPLKLHALLGQLVDYELLLQEAERRGYGTHPAVTLATRETMVQALVNGPLTVSPESLTPAETAAHFESMRARYSEPERRRARHIVVATEAEAMELIAELRRAGKKASQRAAELARERSLDAVSRREAGELGYFSADGTRVGTPERVRPEIAQAVFALQQPGEVAAKPVPTQGGLSVVVFIERIAAISRTLAQVEDEVRDSLAQERSDAAVEELVRTLQAAHAVQIYPERAAAVVLDPDRSAGQPRGFPAAPADPRAPPTIREPDGI